MAVTATASPAAEQPLPATLTHFDSEKLCSRHLSVILPELSDAIPVDSDAGRAVSLLWAHAHHKKLLHSIFTLSQDTSAGFHLVLRAAFFNEPESLRWRPGS